MTRCAACRDRRHRCQSCRERRHGEACAGCCCRCRPTLGLDLFRPTLGLDLFESGDPTAISWDVGDPDDDQAGQVA